MYTDMNYTYGLYVVTNLIAKAIEVSENQPFSRHLVGRAAAQPRVGKKLLDDSRTGHYEQRNSAIKTSRSATQHMSGKSAYLHVGRQVVITQALRFARCSFTLY